MQLTIFIIYKHLSLLCGWSCNSHGLVCAYVIVNYDFRLENYLLRSKACLMHYEIVNINCHLWSVPETTHKWLAMSGQCWRVFGSAVGLSNLLTLIVSPCILDILSLKCSWMLSRQNHINPVCNYLPGRSAICRKRLRPTVKRPSSRCSNTSILWWVTLPLGVCNLLHSQASLPKGNAVGSVCLSVYHLPPGFLSLRKEERLPELFPQTPVSSYSWPCRTQVADKIVSPSCSRSSLPPCPFSRCPLSVGLTVHLLSLNRVCLPVCVTQKLLLWLNWFFFTQEGVYPWLGPPLRWFWIQEFIKGFFTISW